MAISNTHNCYNSQTGTSTSQLNSLLSVFTSLFKKNFQKPFSPNLAIPFGVIIGIPGKADKWGWQRPHWRNLFQI
jgi:hypothetical protein